jgi:hypothetical protein
MKIRPVGGASFHANGWTEGRTDILWTRQNSKIYVGFTSKYCRHTHTHTFRFRTHKKMYFHSSWQSLCWYWIFRSRHFEYKPATEACLCHTLLWSVSNTNGPMQQKGIPLKIKLYQCFLLNYYWYIKKRHILACETWLICTEICSIVTEHMLDYCQKMICNILSYC